MHKSRRCAVALWRLGAARRSYHQRRFFGVGIDALFQDELSFPAVCSFGPTPFALRRQHPIQQRRRRQRVDHSLPRQPPLLSLIAARRIAPAEHQSSVQRQRQEVIPSVRFDDVGPGRRAQRRQTLPEQRRPGALAQWLFRRPRKRAHGSRGCARQCAGRAGASACRSRADPHAHHSLRIRDGK